MHIYAFEKLEVWQDARKLAVMVYNVTNYFPAEERFGLTSQLRRAAVSVSSNIAEGSGRQTVKDQVHFYQIAYSSTLEVLNQLILSNDLSFLVNKDLLQCRQQIETVSNKLNSLRNSISKKLND